VDLIGRDPLKPEGWDHRVWSSIEEALNVPRPVQRGGPKIIVGRGEYLKGLAPPLAATMIESWPRERAPLSGRKCK
jgi:hypothetical protein